MLDTSIDKTQDEPKKNTKQKHKKTQKTQFNHIHCYLNTHKKEKKNTNKKKPPQKKTTTHHRFEPH
jgi:predicted RNA-binding protein with RPS1 domain